MKTAYAFVAGLAALTIGVHARPAKAQNAPINMVALAECANQAVISSGWTLSYESAQRRCVCVNNLTAMGYGIWDSINACKSTDGW